MAGEGTNGYLTPGDRLRSLEEFREHMREHGCPLHAGIIDWLEAAEKRRDEGDKVMGNKFDKMMWMQLGTLIAAVGGLAAALWRATGHAG